MFYLTIANRVLITKMAEYRIGLTFPFETFGYVGDDFLVADNSLPILPKIELRYT